MEREKEVRKAGRKEERSGMYITKTVLRDGKGMQYKRAGPTRFPIN